MGYVENVCFRVLSLNQPLLTQLSLQLLTTLKRASNRNVFCGLKTVRTVAASRFRSTALHSNTNVQCDFGAIKEHRTT